VTLTPSTQSFLTALFAGSLFFGACKPPAPPKSTEPREIHTPAYDLIVPAEQKALPLLRRSGYAKAQ
jgi:hypothetical protein